jgi:hypothetical protein
MCDVHVLAFLCGHIHGPGTMYRQFGVFLQAVRSCAFVPVPDCATAMHLFFYEIRAQCAEVGWSWRNWPCGENVLRTLRTHRHARKSSVVLREQVAPSKEPA